ncbi:hypothetical protein [Streptomyces sp. DSM 40750]|uniref:hypothetical protein n=1 Tax=Streptomyces sp. DSM 40750 TaxID=2801030 RepID=UPI00214D04D5|nr:hypothetical protein [Streptomyces sp. DSM 40750]UUU23007.1 hypothetical protein JIX55_23435 [Streptomyces sp. DSM 40750]
MTDLIGRLLAWAGFLSKPSGRHRAAPGRPHPQRASPPPALDTSLPVHRSPYGLNTPLDGAATIAVRPYVTAYEQRQRRRELALLAAGLDVPGPYWIHGTEVA